MPITLQSPTAPYKKEGCFPMRLKGIFFGVEKMLALPWCKMRHCGNSFGGHLKVLAKGWFWAIKQSKAFREHDWMLEMPQEDTQLLTHSPCMWFSMISTLKSQKDLKHFFEKVVGLCDFLIDFWKKCENNYALLWSTLRWSAFVHADDPWNESKSVRAGSGIATLIADLFLHWWQNICTIVDLNWLLLNFCW